GGRKPNYDAASVDAAAEALEAAGLRANIMIDFSHANSLKDPERQPLVAQDVAEQIARGDDRIFGVMIESHINPGSQQLEAGQPLTYGVSITDGCLGWETSEAVLHELAQAVALRRRHLSSNHSVNGSLHVAIS
ncbi:MAG: 3-deoxy-7-phosphoheptulonate synthase, partial [Gammaproteobacteria bacterium]|nr:3-deoxy-7-phosphoheptulonate synthase [Gammaproteobacteria bacterium]